MHSREQRRSAMGGGITFGPKETDQTIIYQKLKKQHDQERQRKELKDQIIRNKQNDYVSYQKEMLIERSNLSKAQDEVYKQQND